jgi:hypothetical protein
MFHTAVGVCVGLVDKLLFADKIRTTDQQIELNGHLVGAIDRIRCGTQTQVCKQN